MPDQGDVITMMWSTATGSWGGLGWLWVPIMAVMMIGCMLMMGGMMGGMVRRGWYGSRDQEHHRQRPASAEQTLGGRLARGEIAVEEYERLLAVIEHHEEPIRADGIAGTRQ